MEEKVENKEQHKIREKDVSFVSNFEEFKRIAEEMHENLSGKKHKINLEVLPHELENKEKEREKINREKNIKVEEEKKELIEQKIRRENKIREEQKRQELERADRDKRLEEKLRLRRREERELRERIERERAEEERIKGLKKRQEALREQLEKKIKLEKELLEIQEKKIRLQESPEISSESQENKIKEDLVQEKKEEKSEERKEVKEEVKPKIRALPELSAKENEYERFRVSNNRINNLIKERLKELKQEKKFERELRVQEERFREEEKLEDKGQNKNIKEKDFDFFKTLTLDKGNLGKNKDKKEIEFLLKRLNYSVPADKPKKIIKIPEEKENLDKPPKLPALPKITKKQVHKLKEYKFDEEKRLVHALGMEVRGFSEPEALKSGKAEKLDNLKSIKPLKKSYQAKNYITKEVYDSLIQNLNEIKISSVLNIKKTEKIIDREDDFNRFHEEKMQKNIEKIESNLKKIKQNFSIISEKLN